jgi:hypothetical protein
MLAHPEDRFPKIRDLEAEIRKTQAEVVVLDTLSYFHDVDENSNSDVSREIIGKLREICRSVEWSPAVVLVHHFNKSEGMKDDNRARGASALTQNASTVLLLDSRDKRYVLKFSKIKDGPARSDLGLDIDFEAALIKVDEAPVRPSSESRAWQLAVMLEAGVNYRSGDLTKLIGEKFSLADSAAKEVLKKAKDLKIVLQAGSKAREGWVLNPESVQSGTGDERMVGRSDLVES